MVINSLDASVRPVLQRSQRKHHDNSNGHKDDLCANFPLISKLGTLDQPGQLLRVINSVEAENYGWECGQDIASEHARIGIHSVIDVAIYEGFILGHHHDQFDDLSKNAEGGRDIENAADTLQPGIGLLIFWSLWWLNDLAKFEPIRNNNVS